jgi:hypothetical protein
MIAVRVVAAATRHQIDLTPLHPSQPEPVPGGPSAIGTNLCRAPAVLRQGSCGGKRDLTAVVRRGIVRAGRRGALV